VHSEKHIDRTLRERFATKDVHFIFGSHDTKSCLKGRCSGECAAMVQGANRLQRGLNYMSHLEDVLPGYTSHWAIFDGGHNHDKAFQSGYFRHWVFDDDRGIIGGGTAGAVQGVASLQAKAAKADPYSLAARSSSMHKGASIRDHVDREYSLEQCKELCDQNALCQSFNYGKYKCYLLSQCMQNSGPGATPAVESTAEFQTFYKQCNAAVFSEFFLQPSVAVVGAMEGRERQGPAPPSGRQLVPLLLTAALAASLVGAVAGFAAWRRQRLPNAAPSAAGEATQSAAEGEQADMALLGPCVE